MNTNSLPNLSYFNRRDITTLLSTMMPLIFVLNVAIYFHEFVWHAINANLAINLGIIAAASFGVILIVMRLIAAQGDFRIIAHFGYEANQGVYMPTLLEQPWLKNRYVRHYLSHIANTGGTLSSQLEQSSIESELHALQADYDSRMELPQFLVGFMIAMGLLGTFIGLLETLTGISGMLDGMGSSGEDVQQQFMKLVVELRKPLAGMGIAFSASMFGLVTSLMLAFMMTSLRRYVSRVISLARNVMHDLTEMTRESTKHSASGSLSPTDIDKLLSHVGGTEIAQFTGSNDLSGENKIPVVGRVPDSDAALAVRMDVLANKIETLLETISTAATEQQRLTQSMIAVNTDVARSMAVLVDVQKESHAEQMGMIQALINVKSLFIKLLNA